MTRHVASRAAISRYSRFAPKCSPHFACNALAPGEDLPKRSGSCSSATMNGVPVPVISLLLGYSNVSMTLRYAHPSSCRQFGPRTDHEEKQDPHGGTSTIRRGSRSPGPEESLTYTTRLEKDTRLSWVNLSGTHVEIGTWVNVTASNTLGQLQKVRRDAIVQFCVHRAFDARLQHSAGLVLRYRFQVRDNLCEPPVGLAPSPLC